MNRPGSCLIWATPARFNEPDGSDRTIVNSDRAGGEYEISGTAAAVVQSLDDEAKRRLTQEIIENTYAGQRLSITNTTIRAIRSKLSLGPVERADWLLRYLASHSQFAGYQHAFPLSVETKLDEAGGIESVVIGTNDLAIHPLLAWSGSLRHEEVAFLLRYLQRRGFIEPVPDGPVFDIIVLPEGYGHVAEQDQRTIPSSQAFVAMWIHASMNDAYEHGFEKAVREIGYQPLRIDRKEHVNKIDDEIVAEIRRSRFLIADFTCGLIEQEEDEIAIARGGVYYEAGFAQGLNIPVIWTCRQDLIEHVHFDTRQFNHIVWTDPEDLYTQLKNRIGAVIGDGPLKAAD